MPHCHWTRSVSRPLLSVIHGVVHELQVLIALIVTGQLKGRRSEGDLHPLLSRHGIQEEPLVMRMAAALFDFNSGAIRQVGECQLHGGSGSYVEPESRVA